MDNNQQIVLNIWLRFSTSARGGDTPIKTASAIPTSSEWVPAHTSTIHAITATADGRNPTHIPSASATAGDRRRAVRCELAEMSASIAVDAIAVAFSGTSTSGPNLTRDGSIRHFHVSAPMLRRGITLIGILRRPLARAISVTSQDGDHGVHDRNCTGGGRDVSHMKSLDRADRHEDARGHHSAEALSISDHRFWQTVECLFHERHRDGVGRQNEGVLRVNALDEVVGHGAGSPVDGEQARKRPETRAHFRKTCCNIQHIQIIQENRSNKKYVTNVKVLFANRFHNITARPVAVLVRSRVLGACRPLPMRSVETPDLARHASHLVARQDVPQLVDRRLAPVARLVAIHNEVRAMPLGLSNGKT